MEHNKIKNLHKNQHQEGKEEDASPVEGEVDEPSHEKDEYDKCEGKEEVAGGKKGPGRSVEYGGKYNAHHAQCKGEPYFREGEDVGIVLFQDVVIH